MPLSAEVPGILHIVHNATRDLAYSMVGWTDYLQKLVLVTNMLSKPFWRQRLLQTCCQGEHAVHAAALTAYALGDAHVNESRWASVSDGILVLLDIEVPLRACWNADAFGLGTGTAAPMQQQEGYGQLDVHTIDGALSDGFFWGYCKMAGAIAETLLHLMHWAESCPCHHNTNLAHNKLAARALFMRTYKQARCPLAGMRAPS